jgi:tRNA-splicing ligase RtcB (3'-phosphate/5'-hydroxy nucleic acid ligase)
MNENLELERLSKAEWLLPATGEMRVPALVIADEQTIEQLRQDLADNKEWNALRQLHNVACLPGIVGQAVALPDVHPGYGFPIGGVAAFDAKEGVVVVGGVGFDINCGVRLLATPLDRPALTSRANDLSKDLFDTIPAGVGSEGKLRLTMSEIDDLLQEGASYVIERGYGLPEDIEFIEENGCIPDADPSTVSDIAKQRQFRQVGTLGAGNHYVEVQQVEEILDQDAANAYGLREGQIVASIHTGSRALGHQIGQDYLRIMDEASRKYHIPVHERELVCAPISSPEGNRYLSAIACGANCAFANREVITHLIRSVFHRIFGMSPAAVRTVYDIGHNNAKFENHTLAEQVRRLLVHRKGSTRAFGPSREESPLNYRSVGHPTLVGGTMGTASYVMRGTDLGMEKVFGSGIHGAGRALSRKKAAKKYWGEQIQSDLATQGIILRAKSKRGVAEEAPGAYKDVEKVVNAATDSGINKAVARLTPIIVIKG